MPFRDLFATNLEKRGLGLLKPLQKDSPRRADSDAPKISS